MNVNIIGAGNVATVLGRLIQASGHTITGVFSRNFRRAQLLADEVGTNAVSDISEVPLNSDICIVAVSDGAINTVARELQLDRGILVHTSGAVSKELLANRASQYGVLYPLQSMRKELKDIPEIPFVVDGNSEKTIEQVKCFAETLSKKVVAASEHERLRLHLAAVIVSNFTNHLYALTEEYCKKEQTDFSLLFPLINEVSRRLTFDSPANMQTGPAIRGDEETIQKHLDILAGHPLLTKVYNCLSNSIKTFQKN